MYIYARVEFKIGLEACWALDRFTFSGLFSLFYFVVLRSSVCLVWLFS